MVYQILFHESLIMSDKLCLTLSVCNACTDTDNNDLKWSKHIYIFYIKKTDIFVLSGRYQAYSSITPWRSNSAVAQDREIKAP